MKRTFRDTAIIALAMTLFLVAHAGAEPQTRFYDSRGNSIGTAVPQSDGSVRYYDSRGSSTGTSTTMPSGTTYYSPLGSVTGKAVGPAGNGPFGSGARR
jgi:hypothetical protein